MNKENSEMMKSGRMHALFFVGLVPGDQNLKKLVLEEAEIHGDMVVVDLEDTYDNLPFKVCSRSRSFYVSTGALFSHRLLYVAIDRSRMFMSF